MLWHHPSVPLSALARIFLSQASKDCEFPQSLLNSVDSTLTSEASLSEERTPSKPIETPNQMADEPRVEEEVADEPEEAEGKVPEQKQPEDPEVKVLADEVKALRVGLMTAQNIPREVVV
eukprot:g3666.t1